MTSLKSDGYCVISPPTSPRLYRAHPFPPKYAATLSLRQMKPMNQSVSHVLHLHFGSDCFSRPCHAPGNNTGPQYPKGLICLCRWAWTRFLFSLVFNQGPPHPYAFRLVSDIKRLYSDGSLRQILPAGTRPKEAVFRF